MFLIIIVSVAATVAAMLLVRRRAPVEGFFTDSDRAAGIFGVTGTGFAVFLAFVIFSFVRELRPSARERLDRSRRHDRAFPNRAALSR